MTSARDEILGRIRAATADVPSGEPATWEPGADSDDAAAYRRDSSQPGDTVARFAERTAEYRARVVEAPPDRSVADFVANALARADASRVAIPVDLPRDWLPEGLDLLEDADPSIADLDAADGAVTGCAAAIADTGTIVLDGGPAQGPRRLTLLPDLHVCIVRMEQIHASVPEAMAALAPSIRAGRPLTFISGPSATSDIELNRVEGVHGPRTLEVVIVP